MAIMIFSDRKTRRWVSIRNLPMLNFKQGVIMQHDKCNSLLYDLPIKSENNWRGCFFYRLSHRQNINFQRQHFLNFLMEIWIKDCRITDKVLENTSFSTWNENKKKKDSYTYLNKYIVNTSGFQTYEEWSKLTKNCNWKNFQSSVSLWR